MAYAIFITSDDVKRYSIIDGNVDVDKFMQYIKISQDITGQQYLGTDLFNKFQDLIISGEINDAENAAYKSLLVTYIKPMFIHWAMVYYLPFAAYTIANKGVYKHSSENATVVDKSEVDFLVEKERGIAQHYTERFIDYMMFNQQTFPEYNTNTNGDMSPETDNFFGGWQI